jgi:hypothetical protein
MEGEASVNDRDDTFRMANPPFSSGPVSEQGTDPASNTTADRIRGAVSILSSLPRYFARNSRTPCSSHYLAQRPAARGGLR